MKTKLTLVVAVLAAALFGVGCANTPESVKNGEQGANIEIEQPKKLNPPIFDPGKGGQRDIEAAIRRSLNKPGGEITKEDMVKLSRFDITSAQVSDLSPIRGAVNVESLTIRKNQISDLSPLAGMKKLKSLSAYRNRISDLSPLAGLTNLRDLSLSENQITDLSPLAGLKQLTILNLTKNPKLTRAEIDKLKQALPNCVIHHDMMRGAERIEAAIRLGLNKPGGEITKEDMETLKSLPEFADRKISDISLIKDAINMEHLTIRKNKISDLSPLAGMKKLKSLSAYENRIADLSPLAGLTNLRDLSLSNNQITDLSPLAGLKQLTILNLTKNPKLTRAEIDKLKQALPNCVIHHDAKK